MKANTPYVKKYENGILVNPITKENPYLHTPRLSDLKRGTSKLRYWAITRNRFFTGRTATRY